MEELLELLELLELELELLEAAGALRLLGITNGANFLPDRNSGQPQIRLSVPGDTNDPLGGTIGRFALTLPMDPWGGHPFCLDIILNPNFTICWRPVACHKGYEERVKPNPRERTCHGFTRVSAPAVSACCVE